jgi:hypothetical protein
MLKILTHLIKIAKAPQSVQTDARLGGIYASLQQAFALRGGKTYVRFQKQDRIYNWFFSNLVAKIFDNKRILIELKKLPFNHT